MLGIKNSLKSLKYTQENRLTQVNLEVYLSRQKSCKNLFLDAGIGQALIHVNRWPMKRPKPRLLNHQIRNKDCQKHWNYSILYLGSGTFPLRFLGVVGGHTKR
jgi:hypothetical protein